MFRFTIRDVLWLTVVVALAAAWTMDRRAVREKLRREAQNNEVISTRTIDEKEMRLGQIEALITHPQPGEDTLAEIADILKKRSLPKYAVPRNRAGGQSGSADKN
jgi:hypothetical protein